MIIKFKVIKLKVKAYFSLGRFEAQKAAQGSLAEEDEDDSGDQATSSSKRNIHSPHGDKIQSKMKKIFKEEE